jgi:hypothetical protein
LEAVIPELTRSMLVSCRGNGAVGAMNSKVIGQRVSQREFVSDSTETRTAATPYHSKPTDFKADEMRERAAAG